MGYRAELPSRLPYVDVPFVAPAPINARALVARWQLLHWRFRMLRWALGFLLAALVTGFFAFLGFASPVAGAARVLFFALLAAFLVALVVGLIGARRSNM